MKTFFSTIFFLQFLFATLSFANYSYSFLELENGNSFQTRTFTASKGGNLEVNISVGDIKVEAWDKNEVFVKVTADDEEDLDDLSISQDGNTIRVEFHPSFGWYNNIDVVVNIPNQFDVNLETSGGDVQVGKGLRGNLKGSTSGGDIKLGDIGGTIDFSTSGGDIRAKDIQGDVTLNTSGGEIIVGTISGEAKLNTSGGDIRVEKVGKNLEAQTAGGEIIVGDVGGEADLSTYGGDVRVGKVSGKAILSTAGGDVAMEGCTESVKAKTAGGDIRLEGIAGQIDAKTAAGDIVAEIVSSIKGKCRLATAMGDVRLFVPENAKLTVNARIKIRGWWRSRNDGNDIRSDFKAETYEEDEDEHEVRAMYKINGGGEPFAIETAMGNIEIRKSGNYNDEKMNDDLKKMKKELERVKKKKKKDDDE